MNGYSSYRVVTRRKVGSEYQRAKADGAFHLSAQAFSWAHSPDSLALQFQKWKYRRKCLLPDTYCDNPQPGWPNYLTNLLHRTQRLE